MGSIFVPPSAFPPDLPPGGQVGDDGTATDPMGGPTVGQVVDGLKDQLGGLRGKQQSDVKTDPIVQAREVDCSQLPDETACNECLLRKGMIGPPLTPRYVTHKNLVNYDYQLYVANLRSAPLLFTYLVADQADPERSFFSVDNLFDHLNRNGFSRTIAEWHFNACEFDGFWPSECRVVEAKGNYDDFLLDNDEPKGRWVIESVFMPMREQMTRQKSAITIAQPQAKLSWFFMHPRSMLAAVELAGLDVSICTALPMPGEKIL
ncbi:Tox-REase-5 domain-containing protein [Xanthomonas oryzae pv. oryzicola]|uniref:Tox-REase-5 domain-containing protein n=1 Tax=Xanthomonas oryzae TaxID=347 RepID=UPI00064332E6|nr:Tox-REase-5 domain-containing protein [Xanthomonas oryzae]AKK62432.1 hypothetical protein FE36_00155 [Xanthomonas oryzae pv. oryzicola]AKO02426.1 hypothetical protein ACU15_20115 [Xanthomonas oryzae pv. oryzicola]KOR44795.1 hypothetical protein ADT27_13540 [Xanthomonas oryzae]OLK90878.1 hypothetical protein BXOR1_04045 [Xanthomonas oryzae pv. oryzicola]QGH67761.1 hypothetical protein GHV42_21685 [Xanthomonas oryzae pv. oryzicola]